MRVKPHIRRIIESLPGIGPTVLAAYRRIHPSDAGFPGTRRYWERRYAEGGTSGPGSYGRLARFKADTVNAFVAAQGIRSVVEFGCGDGNQLAFMSYPSYLGVDISETSVRLCRERFATDATKRFQHLDAYRGERAELSLSLDVIFHLVEDATYESYMRLLFAAAESYVIVYSSDCIGRPTFHIKHRSFTDWIAQHEPEWRLLRRILNRHPLEGDFETGSWSDFFIYSKGR